MVGREWGGELSLAGGSMVPLPDSWEGAQLAA